jgi:hypothetical protein
MATDVHWRHPSRHTTMRAMNRTIVLAALVFGAAVTASAAGQEPSETFSLASDGICAVDGPCGDIDGSGDLSASDALRVLRKAVGQPVSLSCGCSGPPLPCSSTAMLSTGAPDCYATDGRQVPCGIYMYDEERYRGVPRSFTDNGDGTITDNATGLTWEKLSDDGTIHDQKNTYTWANSFTSKIATLNNEGFAGHSDWRLPNVRELETLVSLSQSSLAAFRDPCFTGCENTSCSCRGKGTGYFWSSTTVLHDPKQFAKAVSPSPRSTSTESKGSANSVRAVRGGAGAPACTAVFDCGDVNGSGSVSASDALEMLRAAVGSSDSLVCECDGSASCPESPTLTTGQTTCYSVNGSLTSCAGTGQDGESQLGAGRSFTDNGDGTITDNVTSLMWEKHGDDSKNWTATWSSAFTKVNSMALGGYSDWRLPNRFELQTLLNFGDATLTTFPAFNTACTPNCPRTACSCTGSGFYWTSSSLQGPWAVSFGPSGGSTFTLVSSSAQFVRAVRGGL